MTGRFQKPIWIVPLLIAGLVAVFGWWGNGRLRQTLEQDLQARLTTTLNANVAALKIWTTNQIRLAISLADQPEVRSAAIRWLDRTPPAPGDFRRPGTELEELGNYLRPRLHRLGYELAVLVNTNFMMIATSMRGRGGPGVPVPEAHTNKFAELFESGQPILITPFKPEPPGRRPPFRGGGTNAFGPGRPPPPSGNRGPIRQRGSGPGELQRRRGDAAAMQVAAPITDDQRIVRGALALVINPTNEFTFILSVDRFGESGETYAFDQTGLLISQSRFDDQLRALGLLAATNTSSALNLRLHDPGGNLTEGFKSTTNLASQPLVHMAAEAVDGEDGVEVKPWRDYRGVPVVGAWRWLPQLGFGVATQIDASEAYRPLRVLQFIFVLLFLLLVLSSVILFTFSIANVTWRRRLGEAELKLKQLGQYTLEEKIGQGGMGVVYRARHALMRRETAVKLLSRDKADAAAVERFEREVRLTCQLTHPNTIQVYDYGHTPEGTFYYAMEYLRGLNLHQLITRFGPQTEGRVIHILAQVCDSLTEAHTAGLVHRDIKPANVFLCERGGVPDCVKVLDFGLVRHYGAQSSDVGLTSKEEFVGTPWFMPPESIRDSTRSDPRSDIYAVGALGYFLISGKYAYEGKSVMEIYEKQLTQQLTPISLKTTNLISPQLDELLRRCLDKEPGRRPQSAAELRSLLRTSPLEQSWSLEARAEWWVTHRAEVERAEPETATTTQSVPTVKIDFESRMK